ncbi:hypothetical protein [Leifsonia sp. C5G2]|uniref:hypothetical protein n=1 Tax=Leifsonia sp. C5G2 TaxID=2735269 RepID=UPI0015845E57|nr:hypothetical protein [Leifsonia sp. C5G2]NUU06361.1 hypothetical protein [Leifsonia sp. C5G2]
MPTDADLDMLTSEYFNLEHPGDPTGSDFTLGLVARHIYQQWPYMRLSLRTWARGAEIFAGTPFSKDFKPEVMHPGWDHDLFGVSVATYISIGFMLASAAEIGSPLPFVWPPEIQSYLELLGGQQAFDSTVAKHFLITIDEFKAQRKAAVLQLPGTPAQRYKHEPFAFNPLMARPIIADAAPDRWLAPCVPAIELKISATSLVYSGLQRWEEAFSHDVGNLFENYVGRNLQLINSATVLPEIVYREQKSDRKSVDWFVVTSKAVILVECKSAIPAQPIREGTPASVAAHVGRLEKAIKQVNKSDALIGASHPAFASIPEHLPRLALVATLGEFDLANSPEVRTHLPTADLPTAVVNIEVIEDLATLSEDALNELALTAIAQADSNNVIDGRALFNGLVNGPTTNPILTRGFDKLPVIAKLAEYRASLS